MAIEDEPILERITQDVVDALTELTEEDGDYEDAPVHRPNPAKPPALADFRFTVVQGEPEEQENTDIPYDLKGWVQPYRITCDLVLPEDDTTPVDRILNRLRADVEKKLLEDHTRGGLAVDTEIRAPELADVAETSRTGSVIVIADVTYRTLENDPYKLPGE